MRALVAGRPLAAQPYVVTTDQEEMRGTTGEDGLVECFIRPDLPSLTVRVGEPPLVRTFVVMLRELDPVTEPAGLQARLTNLGYYRRDAEGDSSAATAAALRTFQIDQQLQPTGLPDDATRRRLLAVHGS
jgi:N-acetylmuramoyl-L-alanine amidase